MGDESEIQPQITQELPAKGLTFKERARKIVWHPLFGIAAGAAIAAYFYYASLTKPELTYYISSTRTPIVQKENLDNFSVTFQGVQITNDLSTVEIQIWNKGNAPIRTEDILEPITIKTANGEPIYQATAKPNRSVVGFNWISAPPNGKSDSLAFNWKILEPSDGIKIQIIYGGNVLVPLSIEGTIVGQRQGIMTVKNINPTNKHDSLFMLILGTVTIVGYSILQRTKFYETGLKDNWYLKYVVFSQYAMGTVMVIFGIVTHLRLPPKPPFGF